MTKHEKLNPDRPDPGWREKFLVFYLLFISTPLYGASKSFLNTFIKLFEALQRSAKMKI